MSEFRQRNIQKLYESIDNNLNHNDSNNINKSNNNVEIDNNNSNRKSLIFKNFNEKDEDKKKNIILLFLFLLIFRIINALTIKTYFNPDEYWQSVEIAHYIVFEYPFLLLILKSFGIHDYGDLIVCINAAFGDLYTYRLTQKLFNESAAKFAVCDGLSFRISLTLASIACILRPTNVIIWIFLGVKLLWNESKSNKNHHLTITQILLDVLVIMICSISLMVAVDYQFYGELIFVPINFLKFNILKSISLFYGRNPWHWYFSQGILVITTSLSPLIILGVYYSKNSFVHQRGVVDVMNYFRYELKYQHQQQMLIEGGGLGGSEIGKNSSGASSGDNDVVAIEDIGFLMPCHSTPYYSNLNYNVTMWFITCEPPINSESAQENYLDESDFFYNNPVKFIYKYFKPTPKILLSNNSYDDDDSFSDLSPPSPSFYKEWPSHLV
ncbi:13558_t:CDS:2 [Entrophospora sp. SA101]|nr:13558_t:CDS:2 [Entrophospora sp. SA101]